MTRQAQNVRHFTGVGEPSAWGFFLAQEELQPISLCLAPHVTDLERWAESFKSFLTLFKETNPTILFYPDGDGENFVEERLSVLETLNTANKPLYIFSTLQGLVAKVPSKSVINQHSLTLQQSEKYNFKELAKKLTVDFSYDSESMCDKPGQMALRGGIIDIYPLGAKGPFRLDFFGDELEAIKPFDPTTQRSDSTHIKELLVLSKNLLDDVNQSVTLFDHLPISVQWVLGEPFGILEEEPSIKSALQVRFKKSSDCMIAMGSTEDWPKDFPRLVNRVNVFCEPMRNYSPTPPSTILGQERLLAEADSRNRFLETLSTFEKKGETIYFLVSTEGDLTRLKEEQEIKYPQLNPIYASLPLPSGFRLSWENKDIPESLKRRLHLPQKTTALLFVTECELLQRHRLQPNPFIARKAPHRAALQGHLDFEALAEGDLLVHLQHGICRFSGLKRLKADDEPMLSLEFKDGVFLHIPLHDSHWLSRYVGLEKKNPSLSKLGSNAWQKTKDAAQLNIRDFAAELLQLQALRNINQGYTFPPDHKWQKTMEDSFPFLPTKDQIKATIEIKLDMEKARPMDRLLCGDVGFGKTEVAIRAAFKAAMAGKQVAILVPTTLLCEQHFRTLKERFTEYPIVVEMLSRFRSPKQKQTILEGLQTGKIDIIVGTHALLSEKIGYKDLGLLIIDEEHRFGVAHKESLKRLRATVDILSMSATPIPRTLYMAIVGARDLSLLETPPSNRLSIETVVCNYDKEKIQRAILLEMNRGGQVFYLHNRISSIQKVANQLQQIAPNAKIVVAHGQMPTDILENTMNAFVEGKYDVMVATTIIESGIDIPLCNTLIVENADHFGLAQLYQIRGRVGRFDRQAYAYFLLSTKYTPSGDAHKRLQALKQHNQLGAGFRIAMRDLELRGAGDLLGSKQSGHIAAIGFDLYCELLKVNIAKLKGEQKTLRTPISIQLDFAPFKETASEKNIQPAYIPETYMPEIRQKISTYRSLSQIETKDALEIWIKDKIDRYGVFPAPLKMLIEITKLRLLAENKGLKSVVVQEDKVLCQGKNGYLKIGPHFPRLTKKDPWSKLSELISIIKTNTTNY